MKLSDLAKKLIISVLVITFICILIAAIYYRSLAVLPFLYGGILGCLASIFKIILLERAVNKAVEMQTNRAGAYIGLQNFLRFAITAIALLAGALVPQISLWGVLAGIMAYQIAVYALRFTSKSDFKKVKSKKHQPESENSQTYEGNDS